MEVEVGNEIEIVVGELMFSFDNFEQWVDKAKGWYSRFSATGNNSVAIDSAGRVCRIGKQFMRARDEGTFPVRVYNLL